MYDYTPIFLIALTFVLLWTLGRFLTRMQNTDMPVTAADAIRGNMVIPGLHAIGLTGETVEELRSLINDRDNFKLSTFIILKKPTFVELENYITALREQFVVLLNRPIKLASDLERIAAANKVELINPPRGFDFDSIGNTDLRTLLEHDSRKRRIISQDFVTRFGEQNYMENFEIYAELISSSNSNTPVTLLATRDDKNRKVLELFVETGIALQGRKIPLQDRLSVLKFSQLREMGQELKLATEFKRRSEAAEALAEIPGSAILLAMLVNVDDTFMIKPEPYDARTVQIEWSVISTMTNLLLTLKSRQDQSPVSP